MQLTMQRVLFSLKASNVIFRLSKPGLHVFVCFGNSKYIKEPCCFIQLQFNKLNSEDLPAEARAKSMTNFHVNNFMVKTSLSPQESISFNTVSTSQVN